MEKMHHSIYDRQNKTLRSCLVLHAINNEQHTRTNENEEQRIPNRLCSQEMVVDQ